MKDDMSRRQLFSAGAVACLALLLPRKSGAIRANGSGPHPTPRPGITGAKVLTKEQLTDKPELVELFDAVRAAPEVVDGIRCNCGCPKMAGFYSLLSCYEDKAMARECSMCQGQGRLATRLHKLGKSLDEIRAAVDAKFG